MEGKRLSHKRNDSFWRPVIVWTEKLICLGFPSLALGGRKSVKCINLFSVDLIIITCSNPADQVAYMALGRLEKGHEVYGNLDVVTGG